MRLSISNIAWEMKEDETVYQLMKQYGYSGLEIAPTRIFPSAPYDRPDRAKRWKESLQKLYGFCIPSIQSIWYGRQEKLFGSERERETLLCYTKKAIDLASAIGSKNLVLGCPRNRAVTVGMDIRDDIVSCFFKPLGDYAASKGTAIGLEAVPSIYGTVYIHDTRSALELIHQVGSEGFRLNLDVGAMICNDEHATDLEGYVDHIGHVHISEPGLEKIKARSIHVELSDLLREEGYTGHVSIEMKKVEDLSDIEEALRYVRETFGD